MTATDELRRLLDERGEDYTRNDFGITWSYYSDPHTATESMDGTLIVTGLTPEHAIAATLGYEPDEIKLTQTYDAGFRNGVMAVFQQLEGIEDYEELQDLIAEYWGEGEGNNER